MPSYRVTTLEKRRIEVLANNTENIMVDLKSRNNYSLKKLVQRKWSNDLFKQIEGPLRKEHAKFFINRYLEELNLHRYCLTDIEAVIDILKVQGEGILHLSLIGSFYLEATVLQLAESLPSTLTCLQFEKVKCSDVALSIVAKNCLNLQKLYLTNCTEVTDYGIATLFIKADGSPNTVMQFLDLRGTSVSEKGVLVALECCPNMTELFHDDLKYIISSIYYCYLECTSISSKTYNLKTLTIDFDCLVPLFFLKPWQNVCPRVGDLSVYYIDTQEELDICSSFKDLKKATVHSLEPLSLSPFLEIRGSDLESLSTLGYIDISIDSVIKFCPNLRCLNLCNPCFGSLITVDVAYHSLKNLRTLAISRMDIDRAKREMTALFLRSPNIKTIKFCYVTGFTDDFASLVAMHTVVHLSNFEVRCCDVNMLTLKKIIMASPYLTCVSIELCKNISQRQVKYLERLKDGLTICFKG